MPSIRTSQILGLIYLYLVDIHCVVKLKLYFYKNYISMTSCSVHTTLLSGTVSYNDYIRV